MIPKILHSIWIGPYDKPQTYYDDWAKVMPDYEIKFWDNKSVAPYIEETIDTFGFDNLKDKSVTYITDIIRMMMLRDYGGVYLDCDIEIIKDFTELLDGNNFVGTFMFNPIHHMEPDVYTKGTTLPEVIANYSKSFYNTDTVNNCFMAATPHHKLTQLYLDLTKHNHTLPQEEQYAMSDWGAGPAIISDVFRHAGLDITKSLTVEKDGVKVYHRDYFHPVNGTERLNKGEELFQAWVDLVKRKKSSYTIHLARHWGGTMFIEKRMMLFGEMYESGVWRS